MVNLFLFFLLKCTDSKIFFPCHFLVAFFYRNFITPLIKFYLTSRHRCIKGLYCRHSVLTNYFNCFGSDLDYSIIINDNTNQGDVNALAADAKVLQKIFPFLDLPEIYRFHEYKLQSQFKKIYPFHYHIKDLFKKLRKIPWLKEKYKTGKTSYHKLKSYRSLKRCFINIGLEKSLSLYLKENKIEISPLKKLLGKTNSTQSDPLNIDDEENQSLYSHHLNLDFFSTFIGDNKTRLNIAALTPEYFFNTIDILPQNKIHHKILRLRKDTSLKLHFKIHVFENLLLCLSTFRTQSYPQHQKFLNLDNHIDAMRMHLKQLEGGIHPIERKRYERSDKKNE